MRWFISSLTVGMLLVLTGCMSSRPYVAPQARGWEQNVPPPDSLRAFQVYLIGDVGEPSPDTGEPVLKLLASKLDSAGPQSAVVFLGDNLYPRGLVDKKDPDRPEAERCLVKVLVDFLTQVEDVVQRTRDHHVLVVGHHPVLSNGTHAGYHPLKHHLFPQPAGA